MKQSKPPGDFKVSHQSTLTFETRRPVTEDKYILEIRNNNEVVVVIDAYADETRFYFPSGTETEWKYDRGHYISVPSHKRIIEKYYKEKENNKEAPAPQPNKKVGVFREAVKRKGMKWGEVVRDVKKR